MDSPAFRSRRTAPRGSLAILALGVLAACSGQGAKDEVVVAYRAYRDAIASQDVAAVRSFVAPERQADLAGPEAETILAMVNEMTPSTPEVREVVIEGRSAQLNLAGAIGAGAMLGTVDFVRIDGEWRIQHESWEASMEPHAPLTDFAGELRSHPQVSPAPRQRVAAHRGAVRALSFTPDGSHVVSIGYDDKTIVLTSAWEGQVVARVESEDRPTDLAMIPDGSGIAVVEADGDILVYELGFASLGPALELPGRAGSTAQIAASADGKLLATTSYDQPVAVWDLSTGEKVQELAGSAGMRGVSFSPQSRTVAFGSQTNTFTVWELDGKSKRYRIPKVDDRSDVWSVALDPQGKRVVTGHMDSSITLWDVEKGKQLANFFVQNASTMDACFGSDGTVFATAQQSGWVFLWDTERVTQLRALPQHQGAATAVAFSPMDGTTFASGGEDGIVALWAWEPEVSAR